MFFSHHFVHLCILTFDIRVDHRDLVIGLNDEPVARVRDDGRLHLDAAVPGRGRVESLEGREKWLVKFISEVAVAALVWPTG